MNPLISIVVPVYNVQHYLAETINSVLQQTYSNWELILVDDGSTDQSAKIGQEFALKDDRISYYYKPNGGQASARNVGIKKSNGEWVSFLDADDLILPEKLADQLADIKNHAPDFLYGLGYYYYPEREEKLVPYNWVSGEKTGYDFFKILYHSCAVNTNTVLVKRKLFDEVGYFNEDAVFRGTEDWELWLRIAKHVAKVYGSPKRNVYYRIHDGGIHLQSIRMKKGKLAIYALYDKDKNVPRLMRLREYRYNYRELLNLLWKENKPDELRTVFKEFTKKDKYGLGTFKQRILIQLLPLSVFMKVSNKITYRIAYRLEHLTYKLFLK